MDIIRDHDEETYTDVVRASFNLGTAAIELVLFNDLQ